MYQKARNGAVKISSVACGFSSIKIDYSDYPKSLKPHSHYADVATVHPDAGQPVYRDAPGHIS